MKTWDRLRRRSAPDGLDRALRELLPDAGCCVCFGELAEAFRRVRAAAPEVPLVGFADPGAGGVRSAYPGVPVFALEGGGDGRETRLPGEDANARERVGERTGCVDEHFEGEAGLLYVDVAGAALATLRECDSLIDRSRPAVFLSLRSGDVDPLGFLRRRGYRIVPVDPALRGSALETDLARYLPGWLAALPDGG